MEVRNRMGTEIKIEGEEGLGVMELIFGETTIGRLHFPGKRIKGREVCPKCNTPNTSEIQMALLKRVEIEGFYKVGDPIEWGGESHSWKCLEIRAKYQCPKCGHQFTITKTVE